jgi:glutamate carboxypeptidase
MKELHQQLQWIDKEAENMTRCLIHWSDLNTGSHNHEGILKFCSLLEQSFAPIADTIERLPLPKLDSINERGEKFSSPSCPALRIRKRPHAPLKIFLGAHMDTVFPSDSPFQEAKIRGDGTLQGPGVADIKGGIVILRTALEALERSPFAESIGWEVLLNPDEEIGSVASEAVLTDCGRRNHLGLIFEPSLPDGTLVSERKGSANFTLSVRGRSAHAGRDFFDGRNAIYAMTHVIHGLESLINQERGLTVNVGEIHGGTAVNVVPAFAQCRFNIRSHPSDNMEEILEEVTRLVDSCQKRDGFSCELFGKVTRPPKPFDPPTQQLFAAVKHCGEELGLPIHWRPTGGVCDGNILAAAGLPTIDTLGVRGDKIHTHDEYMIIDSLVERTRLVALLLMRLARRDIILGEES